MDFRLNDVVQIKAIEMSGFIDGIMHENAGTQYRVVYWSNCERHTVWMHPSEITKQTGEK